MTVTINGNGTVDGLSNLTSGDLTVDTNTLYVDSSNNNVGIGTSSPARRLDVVGGAGNGVPAAIFRPDNAAGINFVIQRDSGGSGTAAIGTSTNHNFSFLSNNTERMRIDASGNVLIGTTSAIGKTTIQVANSGNAFSVKNTSGTAAYNAATFYNNGGSSLVGYIQPSGTTTAYSTASDYRLKENITPMTGALETVAQLKPVTYKWKTDGSNGQGFIAHELQEVVPDCVTGEKDAVDADGNPVYQGVDTSFLVATLTSAIQELKAENDTLKSQLSALETRIQALEGN